MDVTKTIENLDGQQLALWAYLRGYGREKVIHIHDIHRDFPFAKYLFPTDSDDMRMVFKALVQKGLLKADEIPKTYKRVAEDNPRKIWTIILNRLINTSHGYFRDRTYDLPRKVPLHEFAKLDELLRDKHLKDPFLSSFSTDTRLGRHGWWKTVCQIASLYDNAIADNTISSLIFEFAGTAGLTINVKNKSKNQFCQKIDEIWRNKSLVELSVTVDNVTPWKTTMPIQVILVQWQDMSLKSRDQIKQDALKVLVEEVTTANMILPIGNPSENDRDTLISTQLAVFTPEDIRDIYISKEPSNRFRELLRKRMDIEHLSPYQYKGFVPEAMFFGRNHEEGIIASHPETNYAVYGGRQSGKTSLMKQLERIYQGERPVGFINCELVSSEKDFLSLLCQSLAIKAEGSYEEFKEAEKGIKPNTLLIIDEVDHALKSCDPARILSILRHINGQYRTRCILSGSTRLYEQYRDIESPMYNFAEPLPLGPFTILEAKALAKEPMLGLDVCYEEGDSTVMQLINLCGRFPNLIQLMCHQLIIELKEKEVRTISSDMLNKVFYGNAFGNQVYQEFLHNFNSHQKLIVYASLLVKGMSLNVITERVQRYYDLSVNRIEQLLDELVLLFLFEKSGTNYKWSYEGFPTILRNRIKDEEFMIKQTIKEIEGETKNM